MDSVKPGRQHCEVAWSNKTGADGQPSASPSQQALIPATPPPAPHEKAPRAPHFEGVAHDDNRAGWGMRLFDPTNMVMQATTPEIQAPSKWLGQPGEHSSYYSQQFDPDNGTVSFQPPREGVLEPEQLAHELYNTHKCLDELDADVILAIIAQSLISQRLSDSSVWIKPETILVYRGIKPVMKTEGLVVRSASYHVEPHRTVIASFERIRYLYVTVSQELRSRGKRRRPIETQSHLIVEGEII